MTKRKPAGSVTDVLAQLDDASKSATIDVDGEKVAVSSLDKPLWPKVGRRRALTKRDLLRYYTRVSPWLLPHLAGRPLFATRFPNGINGKSFFQKHWDTAPDFARRVAIYATSGDTDGEYLICENLATLLWLGQMGSLELHAWFSASGDGPGHAGSKPHLHGVGRGARAVGAQLPRFRGLRSRSLPLLGTRG